MVALVDSLTLRLEIRDREVIEALSQFVDDSERNAFALAALRIGVLALKQARGDLDKQTIREEADRLLQTLRERLESHQNQLTQQLETALRHYFDPNSGQLHQRIQRLLGQNGELEQFLRQYIGQQDSELCKTLAAHVGKESPLMQYLSPQQRDGLLALLQKLLEDKLSEQRQQVLSQFSLDNQDGALCRLLRELREHHDRVSGDLQTKIATVLEEFSLDRSDSALSRLVRNVEDAQRKITAEFSLDKGDSALSRLRRELSQMLEKLGSDQRVFQEEVKKQLAALQARKEEMQRSVRHGLQFENALCEHLRNLKSLYQHAVEFVGDSPGKIPRCKVGDILVQLNNDHVAAGAKIVVEAKDQQGYTFTLAREEIQQARANREAQIGIFVFSRSCFPKDMPPLSRWDNDVLTFWDPEDSSTDIYLEAAVLVAQALCVRTARQQSLADADIKILDDSITNLEKGLQSLDKIEKSANAIKNQGEEILKESTRLRKNLQDQLDRLRECADSLRRLFSAEAVQT